MLILNGLSEVPVHRVTRVAAPGRMWNIELYIRTEARGATRPRLLLLLLLLQVLGSQQVSSLDSLIGNTSCDISDWGTATSATFRKQHFLIVLQC